VVNCADCGEIIATREIFERVVAIFEKEGADSWFDRPVEDFLPMVLAVRNVKANDS
jgi:isoleucyl-tRNA synthetase